VLSDRIHEFEVELNPGWRLVMGRIRTPRKQIRFIAIAGRVGSADPLPSHLRIKVRLDLVEMLKARRREGR